jgi:hypothetical protein
MLTADPPELVNVSERLELLPFCTLPKDSADGDAARVEPPLEPPLEFPGDTPPQPVSSAIPVASKSELMKQRRDPTTRNGPIP